MSDETLSIMRRLDTSVAEIQASLQCAPLLTGIKVSNLLQIRSEQMEKVFRMFEGTQISCRVLSQKERKTAILLYRRNRLIRYLSQEDVRELMEEFGYSETVLEQILEKLSVHYQAYVDGNADFPHEIGLFLGYPLDDVKGFIENNGRNSKYTGLWKVYGDKAASIRMFEKYRKCFSVYSDLWRSGRRDIFQLTVAG